MTLYLHGLGHFHPENEITNRFLEELDIGTDDAWILDRVGIRSRRTTLSLDYVRETRNRDLRAAPAAMQYSVAELSARAATLAATRAGIRIADVGMLIAGSSAPDHLCPADACQVARELGIEVPALDLNSACTSLLVQIHFLAMMRPEALPPYVLLIGSDTLTKTVDYTDRSSAVLWGDGAAAAIVSTQVPSRARILATSMDSRPSAADKVRVPRTSHFVQEGRTVQTFAIRQTVRALSALADRFAEDGRELHFVGHQANLRMLENVCRRCEIPPERHHANVEWYGNTGAASSASVVSMRWEKWTPRDDVAVVGVGGGLTWASYLIRFGDDS